MPICPKCGKPGFKGLCPQCAPNPFIEKLKGLTLVYCCRSFRVKIGHKWVDAPTLEEAVLELVDYKIQAKQGVELTVSLLDDIPVGPGVDRKTTLEIEATHLGETQVFQVPVHVQITISPTHATAGSNYFEGTFQLRNYNPKHHKHILDFIRKELLKHQKRGGFVNKEVKQKGGFDFVITKKSLIPPLAKKIVNEYGGEVVKTAKLQTMDRQKSKQVYRDVILVRLPEFVKGEVVEVDGTLYKIATSKGKRFSCVRLEDFSKKTFETTKHKYKIIATREQLHKTRVSQTTPELQVLHPSTYQPTPVQNKTLPKTFRTNENVTVVEHKGIWIVS